ncbi:MAG TPA: ATP-binding protein [Bacteroidales bacterium]|jgi:predicted AAA+ superfamily ATPase|nr:ATP-binding protein [Bacteroidales bacterium]
MIGRSITPHLQQMITKFPVVSLTGPRQSGKTTLLRSAFPDYRYLNLERLDIRELLLADPMGYLISLGPRVIFDEAQNVPELFSYIQVISDERNIPGQYILSGSQSFLLNEKIAQSLSGRVSINHLFPFDTDELTITSEQPVSSAIYTGFYPRIFDQDIEPADFYPSYLQTYVERDIRTLKAVENLNTFSRFLGLCAGRIGQVLNLSSLANDAGIAVNTAKAWLSLLEASFILFQLQPYYRNFSKRIIKSPKLYFYDTGVASSLLKLSNAEMLATHYQYGALVENFIISDIIKKYYHSGKRPSVYYWRESNGSEIDCIIERSADSIAAIEIKGGQTFSSDHLKNIRKIVWNSDAVKVEKMLVYMGDQSFVSGDVRVIPWKEFSSWKLGAREDG